MESMNPDDLRKLYESETGKPWDADAGVPWLNIKVMNDELNLFKKTPVLDTDVFITLSDKASWLGQRHYHICKPDSSSVASLRIRPESWQSLNSIDKKAFKAAIAYWFAKFPHTRYEGRICLTFLFICSARRKTRDLDNMAKLIMDSLKGIVMGDDREVDHLSLMRLTHEGEEEFVTFQIGVSGINNHDNVVHGELRHGWSFPEMLRIEDFRK